jgi:CubicO group peptidase (beta-lactamase class C family)
MKLPILVTTCLLSPPHPSADSQVTLVRVVRLSALCLLLLSSIAAAQTAAQDLVGLWYAKQRFGPDVRGRVVLDRSDGAWRASIAGKTMPVRAARDSFAFDVPDNGGSFYGRLRRQASDSALEGWWRFNRVIMPVTLTRCGAACFHGRVDADDDALTFWLKVTPRADGTLGAFLRNPERNLGGMWIPLNSITRFGDAVTFLDRSGKAIASGRFVNGVITVALRGATFDFRRLPDTAHTDFYARGRPTVKYTYAPPRAESDGWPVARLRDVGIDEDSIAAFVQMLIDTPIDSVYTPWPHALLVARHGRLVLEEYFHGDHADNLHNTRSGSKTHVTALIGAAMHAGVRITPEARVYETLRPRATNLAERKQALTLEHLLTMTGGFDCNDSGERPGDEDRIQSDTVADWARVFLDVDMVRDPGTAAFYCSMEPFVAGLMLQRIAGRGLPDLFHELIARPLGFRRYALHVSPLGDVYFGGGHAFTARDYLKLPQVYLNGGTWAGRRIMSKEWVDRSMTPRLQLGSRRYGYLWWVKDYPYRGRMIQAYMQLGNGSQNAIFIPDLDLAIVTFGGNYNSPSINYLLNVQLPNRILPAVAPGKP